MLRLRWFRPSAGSTDSLRLSALQRMLHSGARASAAKEIRLDTDKRNDISLQGKISKLTEKTGQAPYTWHPRSDDFAARSPRNYYGRRPAHMHAGRTGSGGSPVDIEFETTPVLTKTISYGQAPGYKALDRHTDPIESVPNICEVLKPILFSPGVHYAEDPRTKHNNYEYPVDIPHVDDFKFDKIKAFIPASRDERLLAIARKENKHNKRKIKYYSSSSSLTAVLKQLHVLLSNNRPLDTSFLSKSFPATTTLSRSIGIPVSSIITPHEGGVYSMQADRSTDTEILLSCLGNVMELMMTSSEDTFKEYLKDSKKEPEDEPANAYHYAKMGKFLMRSQLDAKDTDLPGTGVFDLKTRAVCAVRYDIPYTDFCPTNYEINHTYGLYESFERELFEMARIVMFKYSLQARIGDMDGIMVAYHNVKKILGFQYLPLSFIDNIYFGPVEDKLETYKINEPRLAGETGQQLMEEIVNDIGEHWQNKRETLSTLMADHEFAISMKILEDLLDLITAKTKSKPFRMVTKRTPDSIQVVVVELDTDMVSRLDLLGAEMQQQDKDEVSATQADLPSERIKYLALNRAQQGRKFRRLNGKIWESAAPKGCYMFTIKTSQKFDDEQGEYPTPSVEILDNPSGVRWDTNYEIAEVADKTVIKDHYFQFMRRLANGQFISFNVPDFKGDLRFDENASTKQNLLRAYSAKALERAKKYRESLE